MNNQLHRYVLRGREVVLEPDLQRWGEWMTRADRRVALTEVTSWLRVSSVFLGLDHQFGQGPPLLFESMVFADEESLAMRRYSSWAEAEVGHLEMVKELEKQLEEAPRAS